MIFYAITDKKYEKRNSLSAQIAKYISLGVNWIQIREKGLTDGELLNIATNAKMSAKRKNINIFLNNRADIANLSSCDGVHLSSDSISIKKIKRKFKNLLVIKSCHNITEIKKAEDEGADAVTISPIFETPEKQIFLKPLGLEVLKKSVDVSKIPVIALGGINNENIYDILKTNVYGVAAIRFFNEVKRKEFQKIKISSERK